jgi:outer membrane protein
MIPITTRRVALALASVFAVFSSPARARAQNAAPASRQARALSLEEALHLAETQSHAVKIARAGVQRSTGQQYQARSQYLPQIGATAGYTRTLKSQFQGLNFGGGADTTAPTTAAVCAPNIPANATQAQRDAALAQAITCQASGGGGFDFTQTGFGAANQWALGLSLSQNVFTGGRITGQNRAANAARTAADIEVSAQHAQLALDVTQAYYDAVLADQLVALTASSLGQTEEVLRQTRLARQVGNQSEFDLLRAQVTRDNQLPLLIARRSDRDVAYLRLKQILKLPLDDSVALTTPVEDSTSSGGPVLPAVLVNGQPLTIASADTVVADRAPVRQAEATVRAQQGLLQVARGERLPQIAITSGYQRLFFPQDIFPQLNQYRQNWTIGVAASLPIFTGGRIRGSTMIAEANVTQSRELLEQTREFAALDARVALNTYQQYEAAWRASQGTAEQASRAYSIDQIRYREGISTQTDLTQSRLLLEQAVINRAIAARAYAVARMRLALLKDLPLQSNAGVSTGGLLQGGGGTAGGTGSAATQGQGQQQQTQQRTQSASAGAGGQLGGGSVQP